MYEPWQRSVEEKQSILEEVADSDLPLADDVRALLDEFQQAKEVDPR